MKQFICLTLSIFSLQASAQSTAPPTPPPITREFRASWIATIYNLDWPSNPHLSPSQQQTELIRHLDRMKALKLNAVILQVRPNGDALYRSSLEPWSPWLSGKMGTSPGYDPLSFAIQAAHARGLELHAWFNPFRALPSRNIPTNNQHISRQHPELMIQFGSLTWINPANEIAQQKILNVILDVVNRYDIDGVHLDDYFYPYPQNGKIMSGGKSPAERRNWINHFVSNLYQNIKQQKPWIRVGISPFGIWRPGVPSGIEAGFDSYEDLGADARLWLAKGWIDYLAPQLYWPDQPTKQSFSRLLTWWQAQGPRPVWPGIALDRVNKDRSPAELTHQIRLTRNNPRRTPPGQLLWSAKYLANPPISHELQTTYTQPAIPPAMPWLGQRSVPTPKIHIQQQNGMLTIHLSPLPPTVQKIALQTLRNGHWQTESIFFTNHTQITFPTPQRFALTAFDRFGNASTTTSF